MILTANRLYGTRLWTRDGASETLRDLVFDDRTWRLRYLVAGLGRGFRRVEVLLRPEQIETMERSGEELRTVLTLAKLKRAPRLMTDPPVAKQGELKNAALIAWEAYWSGIFDDLTAFGNPHLRNMRAVTGHRVHGLDREAGFIDDFVIDGRDWKVRYLVVRLGRPSTSRRVIVDPHLVDSISWENHGVWIHLPKKSIEQCEEFRAVSA